MVPVEVQMAFESVATGHGEGLSAEPKVHRPRAGGLGLAFFTPPCSGAELRGV